MSNAPQTFGDRSPVNDTPEITPPAASAPMPPRRRWAMTSGAALAIVVLVGAIAWTANDSRRGTESQASSTAEPAVVEVHGTMTLTDLSGVAYGDRIYGTSPGSPCFGKRGYDDIQAGAQVTVSSDGEVVALGELGPGRVVRGTECEFEFVVEVPAGRQFYSVEIAHRGEVNYSASDLSSPLRITLG